MLDGVGDLGQPLGQHAKDAAIARQPEAAAMVVDHRPDPVGRQSLARRHGGEPAVAIANETILIAAEPERAVRPLGDRDDEDASKAISGAEASEAVAGEPKETALRPDPQRAIPRDVQRPDRFVSPEPGTIHLDAVRCPLEKAVMRPDPYVAPRRLGESADLREHGTDQYGTSVAQRREEVAAAHPQRAVGGLVQRANLIREQSLAGAIVCGETTMADFLQAAAPRPDPHGAVASLEHRGAEVLRQAVRSRQRKDLARSELNETAVRADPDAAFTILVKHADGREWRRTNEDSLEPLVAKPDERGGTVS